MNRMERHNARPTNTIRSQHGNKCSTFAEVKRENKRGLLRGNHGRTNVDLMKNVLHKQSKMDTDDDKYDDELTSYIHIIYNKPYLHYFVMCTYYR